MKTRILGKNGPELTVVGLGAWSMGGSWEFGWGPVDDKESVRTIHRALDFGINWIDTAAVYGLGHSEEIVGQALRGIRDEVFVATKCGMVWDDKGVVTKNLKPVSIRREVEASLRRLGTDHIDLYQFHWPDPQTPVEDSWTTMADLVKEGKVRSIGVSNYSVADLERCRAIAPVQSLQPPYSMLNREVERELLPYCQSMDIGVVAYSPLASGLLTGNFNPDKLAPDDWRKKNRQFSAENRAKAAGLLAALQPLAEKHSVGVGAIAIAWVLRTNAVTSAIVGARKQWQIEDTVGASEVELTASDVQAIESHLKGL